MNEWPTPRDGRSWYAQNWPADMATCGGAGCERRDLCGRYHAGRWVYGKSTHDRHVRRQVWIGPDPETCSAFMPWSPIR